MTAPLCKHCGREITQGMWGAEGDEPFRVRLESGFCRRKCARGHKPLPSPKVQTMELVSRRVGAREEMVTLEKELTVRDLARLAYARSLPCCVCGAVEGIHSHHEQEIGKGVMGGKTSDRRTAPLCPHCHFLRHSQGRSFYGDIDIEVIILKINAAYDTLCQSKKCS
jgi:hypothetical protein